MAFNLGDTGIAITPRGQGARYIEELRQNRLLEQAKQSGAMQSADMSELARRTDAGTALYQGPRTMEGQLFGRQAMSAQDLMGRNMSPEQVMAQAQAKFNPKPKDPLILSNGAEARDPTTYALLARNEGDPLTDAGKLAADLKAGNIDQKAYNAGMFKLNSAPSSDENWSNPVAEIGPDGKPIQVRYGSKGGRKVVDGATPARQGNAFDRADYWRGQLKPYLDSAQNSVTQSRKVKTSLALSSGVGDIAAINALQKQIDEGAVVRDEDVALMQSAQSLVGRFLSADGSIKKGTVLTPELRIQMQAASDALTRAVQDGVQSRVMPYVPTMKTEGVELENIVPQEIQQFYGFSPPNGGWSIKKVN